MLLNYISKITSLLPSLSYPLNPPNGGLKLYSSPPYGGLGGKLLSNIKKFNSDTKVCQISIFLHKQISMQIFYAPDIKGDDYTLDEQESKHVIRVLRMVKGAGVKLIDGKGNLYEGIIADPDQKKCTITITGIIKDFEKREYRLHIAISPLKNPERFEWFIEKSVEIGVDEITPLICRNTEKPGIKNERVNNIIISAMKQSLKASKPVLNNTRLFNDFINRDFIGSRMIAHCNDSFKRSKVSDIYSKNENAVILIGPEGDFSEEEIKAATGKDFRSVHLGLSRLRTETAGVAACHSIYFINQ
jgi:16S rRNA (uracil1498-N3)-methyltransferase